MENSYEIRVKIGENQIEDKLRAYSADIEITIRANRGNSGKNKGNKKK